MQLLALYRHHQHYRHPHQYHHLYHPLLLVLARNLPYCRIISLAIYYKSQLNFDGIVPSDSEGIEDLDGGKKKKKSAEDAVAELAQDVALAQYKMRLLKGKSEANNRQAKV